MNIDLNHSKIVLQLSYLNVIKISGRDAIGFLNDQFTNDITAMEPGIGNLMVTALQRDD